MILNNIKSTQKSRGFTIVELLVVIVVIGILAAITIVSYTGITNKANTSSAQSTANNVIQKAELFAQENSGTYPAKISDLTGAASTKTYYLTGVTGDALTAKPATPNLVNFQVCTGGVKVFYWDYTNGNATSFLTAGSPTGTCTSQNS